MLGYPGAHASSLLSHIKSVWLKAIKQTSWHIMRLFSVISDTGDLGCVVHLSIKGWSHLECTWSVIKHFQANLIWPSVNFAIQLKLCETLWFCLLTSWFTTRRLRKRSHNSSLKRWHFLLWFTHHCCQPLCEKLPHPFQEDILEYEVSRCEFFEPPKNLNKADKHCVLLAVEITLILFFFFASVVHPDEADAEVVVQRSGVFSDWKLHLHPRTKDSNCH